jgi:hypothetical protein
MDDKNIPALNAEADHLSHKSRRLLNKLFLGLLLLVGIADAIFIGYFIFLVIFAYSGNGPTSVNAITFPIAIFLYIVVGIPAVAITFLIWLGYTKTKPRRQ